MYDTLMVSYMAFTMDVMPITVRSYNLYHDFLSISQVLGLGEDRGVAARLTLACTCQFPTHSVGGTSLLQWQSFLPTSSRARTPTHEM